MESQRHLRLVTEDTVTAEQTSTDSSASSFVEVNPDTIADFAPAYTGPDMGFDRFEGMQIAEVGYRTQQEQTRISDELQVPQPPVDYLGTVHPHIQ